MSGGQFDLEVVGSTRLTPRVVEIGLRLPQDRPFAYVPGQFITLHLPDGGEELRRSYSIAVPPRPDGTIALAVGEVPGGRATRILFGVRPGERLRASGPFGRFVLRADEPCRRLYLVGTGTGVAPYRTMLPEIERWLAADPERRATLLLGVRSPEERLYGEEFRAFAAAHPTFTFLSCQSRALSDPPAPDERPGYVQRVLEELAPDPAESVVYLCGNPAMIDEATAHLKARGFPLANIRREKYVSSN
jgi:ferredoxin-NADP reductase